MKRARGGASRLNRAAAVLAAALAAVLYLPRLPPSTDFIVPRRLGASALLLLVRLPAWARGALSWSALLALAAGLAAVVAQARSVPARGRAAIKPARVAVALAGAAAVLLLLREAAALGLDVVENAWFPPESLDWREPAAIALILWAAARAFLRTCAAALAWALGRAKTPFGAAPGRSAAAAAAAAGLCLIAVLGYGAGRRPPWSRPGATRPREVVVLVENGDGRPAYESRRVDAGAFSPEALAAAEKAASRACAWAPQARRFLLEAYTVSMDADGLRRTLLAAHRAGDPLSRFLLLENLSHAPLSADAAGMLDELSLETRYRVGPRAAAALAAAYARFGLFQEAARWRERAGSGIPPGLLPSLAGEPAFVSGRLRGSVSGAEGVRVALYARSDPGALYRLGPEQLVDAVTADGRGRFEFKRLPEGSYFLAFAFDAPGEKPPRLFGYRGDVAVGRRRPSVTLAPLEIRF